MGRRARQHPYTLAPLLRDRLLTALRGGGFARTVLLRRLVACALVVMAAVLAITPDDRGTTVLVATLDLPAGTVLDTDAVRAVARDPAALPDGAVLDIDAVVGQVLAAPIRRGEAIVDVRLTGPRLAGALGADGDSVQVPVRLADHDIARLLRPGIRVDVVTVDDIAGGPSVLADDAVVLAVLDPDPAARRPADAGPLVLVALSKADAVAVAGASLSAMLTVTLD